jgi:hypothetical protein
LLRSEARKEAAIALLKYVEYLYFLSSTTFDSILSLIRSFVQSYRLVKNEANIPSEDASRLQKEIITLGGMHSLLTLFKSFCGNNKSQR